MRWLDMFLKFCEHSPTPSCELESSASSYHVSATGPSWLSSEFTLLRKLLWPSQEEMAILCLISALAQCIAMILRVCLPQKHTSFLRQGLCHFCSVWHQSGALSKCLVDVEGWSSNSGHHIHMNSAKTCMGLPTSRQRVSSLSLKNVIKEGILETNLYLEMKRKP